MADPGDVMVVGFPGAQGLKRRPVVVLSTAIYHRHRPDLIAGLLTTNVASSTAPTDYILQDWLAAGLNRPSAFRCYIATLERSDLPAPIGKLSETDWREVQKRVGLALAADAPPNS